jgi:predicted metal-dependent enzyme (double-stranded beta helix superfamily)
VPVSLQSVAPAPARHRAANTPLPLAELTSLVRHYTTDPDLWLPRLRLPGQDQRWWTRLSAGEHADVWLLSWLPGHSTDLHDHGRSAAAFAVVRGSLTELRLDGGGRPSRVVRRPGSVTWLAPGVVHDVHGAGTGPAVSIHAYSPPLTEMTYYARDPSGRLGPQRTVATREPEERVPR